MASFNKVIIAGNLTRKPELRYTPKGTAIAKFSLAINRTWTADGGEKKEEVDFVEVTAWAGAAETIARYLDKGNPLLVEGRLSQETWEDKDSKKERSKLVVVLEGFSFLGGKKRGENGHE